MRITPRAVTASDPRFTVGTISILDALQKKKRYMAWELHPTGAVGTFDGVVPGEVASGRMAPRSKASIGWPHGCFHREDTENRVLSFATVAPNGKLLAAAWEDSTIVLWALSDGSIIHQLRHAMHSDTVSALAFSPDSTRLVSGSVESNAIIWSAKEGRGERVPWEQAGDITTVTWSSHGDWVAAGTQKAHVLVYNSATGSPSMLTGHDCSVTKVAFSPTGARLASSADLVIFVWNPMTGEKLAELNGHELAVWSFAFSVDGARIATASEDATSNIWDAETGDKVVVLKEHTDAVMSVAFSPDGEVATGSYDGTLIIRDPKGQRRRVFDTQPSTPTELVAYSSDGSLVASGHIDGSVRLWGAQSAMLLAVYIGHFGKIRSMDFTYSNGSEHLVTSSSDSTIRTWNISDTLRVL